MARIAKVWQSILGVSLLGAALYLAGYLYLQATRKPAIEFSHLPVADVGGPETLEPISGLARNADKGNRLVLYAYSFGEWWLQPYVSRPFTILNSESRWQNSTHLGSKYLALLVDGSFKPVSRLKIVPGREDGVLASAVASGITYQPKTIHFSGYEWEIRQLASNAGGKLNPYDPDNARVDQNGMLHLKLVHRDDQWFCADVGLTESLGQGVYTFLVRDLSELDPAAVLRIYTWEHFKRFNSQLATEVSRWGNPNTKNTQFVVFPHYEPNNLYGFETPPGQVAFSLNWRPGKVHFDANRRDGRKSSVSIASHTFDSGVPPPEGARVHISLYVYGNSHIPIRNPAEIIIERFQYVP